MNAIVVELAAERRRQGLSQREVARGIGTSNSTLWQWENGRSLPTLGLLETWAGVLGYRLDLVVDE